MLIGVYHHREPVDEYDSDFDYDYTKDEQIWLNMVEQKSTHGSEMGADR